MKHVVSEQIEKKSPAELRNSAVRGDAGRVLVADADEAMRGLFMESLTDHGFKVIEAHCTAEVLDKLIASLLPLNSAGTFDAILVDANLPGEDIFEVLKRLRNKGVTAHAIILSAVISDAMFREADRFAPVSILRKPFYLAQLISIIKDAVNAFPKPAVRGSVDYSPNEPCAAVQETQQEILNARTH